MTDWFTADLHLGHYKIMKYCKRPFETTEEMDKTLISNWNSVVENKDRVYVLGDFAFIKHLNQLNKYLDQLNGQICLIKGNHDKIACRSKRFEFVKDLYMYRRNEHRIVLSHYAMHVWDRSHFWHLDREGGAYHLYGHSHGN